MAIAFDKHVGTGSINMATTGTITTPAGGVAVGNLVVVRVVADNAAGSVNSVTDARGNTYTPISASVNQGAHTVARNFASILGTALQSGDLITVTINAKGAGAIAADAWSGVSSATPVASNKGQGSSTTPSSGNATPTAVNQLVVGIVAYGNSIESTNDSDTTDGSWNQLTFTGFSNRGSDAAYKISSGTTAQNYDNTITSANWISEIAIFAEPADASLPRVNPYRQLLAHQ